MITKHRQRTTAAVPDRTLTHTPIDAVGFGERRQADRFPSVRPARAEAYRLGMATGADFADELVDVSEFGIKLQVSLAVRRGERFDVTLWGPSGEWCGRFQAIAMWSIRTGPAASLVGLRLGRPLPRRAVSALTTPPVDHDE